MRDLPPRGLRDALGSASSMLAVVAACGGGNAASQIARPPDYAPRDQSKCSVGKSHDRPLVVEWPSADRQELEAKVRQGVVAVRYVGCDMDVLERCTVPAKYAYTGSTRKQDRVEMKDEDDLYAQLPVGAARLEGKLETSGRLTVAMDLVGRYEAERSSVRADELRGECAGATHFVYGIAVGAFDFYAGADAQVGAGAGVASVGAGARSQAQRETLTRDGDTAACAGATSADKAPPDNCGALIRIEVVPLAAASSAVATLTPTSTPTPTSTAAPTPPATTNPAPPAPAHAVAGGARGAREYDPLAPPAWVSLTPATISASSFINQPPGDVHRPRDAFDGNGKTAWQVRSANGGVGEWIEAVLDRPRHLRSVRVVTGCDSSYGDMGDLFPLNSHLRRFHLVIDDAKNVEMQAGESQRAVSGNLDIVAARVRLVVDEAWLGTKWPKDLCVGEVELKADP